MGTWFAVIGVPTIERPPARPVATALTESYFSFKLTPIAGESYLNHSEGPRFGAQSNASGSTCCISKDEAPVICKRGDSMRFSVSLDRVPVSLILVMVLLFGLPTDASPQAPDPDLCYASVANSEPVSVLVRPDGGGWPLAEAMLFGGTRTNATITLTVVDGAGTPVIGFPAEGLYLVGSGCDPFTCLNVCGSGSIADGSTNALGQTTFSGPLWAGGSNVGAGVMIDTIPLPESPLLIQGGDLLQFNGPDINGDLAVNLVDVSLFAGDYFGSYDYRSDFYWDGVVNLTDISILAQSLGASCP